MVAGKIDLISNWLSGDQNGTLQAVRSPDQDFYFEGVGHRHDLFSEGCSSVFSAQLRHELSGVAKKAESSSRLFARPVGQGKGEAE